MSRKPSEDALPPPGSVIRDEKGQLWKVLKTGCGALHLRPRGDFTLDDIWIIEGHTFKARNLEVVRWGLGEGHQ